MEDLCKRKKERDVLELHTLSPSVYTRLFSPSTTYSPSQFLHVASEKRQAPFHPNTRTQAISLQTTRGITRL